MQLVHLFIRIDKDWLLDDYKEHALKQINALKDISPETVFISNDQNVELDTKTFDIISQLIGSFKTSQPQEVTLETRLSDYAMKDVLADPYTNRLSFMEVQDEEPEAVLEQLKLFEEQSVRTNLDWDFTQRFSGSDIEQLIKYGSKHISIYGLEDEEEFEQVSIALWSEGYENYDDYHFAKDNEKSLYLQACRHVEDNQVSILGIGPNAKSSNLKELT